MQLSNEYIATLNGTFNKSLLNLPEKIIQFGTGVLLRGLCDGIIHQANTKGIFNGRIVVVKSTNTEGVDAFAEQNNLYTVCIRGIENNKEVAYNYINTSISRVINANTEWESILDCATNEEINIVLSNTTEAGLVYQQEQFAVHEVPISFPGKLTAYLYKRFTHFRGDTAKGMVIIPTELLPNNGNILKGIVLKQAHQHFYQPAFIQWLNNCNQFCNSLVDKIVPGKPTGKLLEQIQHQLPYTDKLLLVAEPYTLWAIEGNSNVHKKLPFATSDNGVIVKQSIEEERELKLRLLNATHSFLCAKALLDGFTFVKSSFANATFATVAIQLMEQEISNAITLPISKQQKNSFTQAVIDRFKNPFIEHQWSSIATEYTSKIKSRCVPLIIASKQNQIMATCMACYIYYAKLLKPIANNQYQLIINNVTYTITDTAMFMVKQHIHLHNGVENILADSNIWGTNLMQQKSFIQVLQQQLAAIEQEQMVAI